MDNTVYSYIAYVLAGYQTKKEVRGRYMLWRKREQDWGIRSVGWDITSLCRVHRESLRDLKGVRKQDKKALGKWVLGRGKVM